jgi:hypothetical protein
MGLDTKTDWPTDRRSQRDSLTHKYNKKFWEEIIAYVPWYDTGHIENDSSNNYSVVACVFVNAVTFLPSRCLATIEGFLPNRCLETIGELLPSRYLAAIGRYTYRHRDWWEGFLAYFPYLEKIKVGCLCVCVCVCVCLCIPPYRF